MNGRTDAPSYTNGIIIKQYWQGKVSCCSWISLLLIVFNIALVTNSLFYGKSTTRNPNTACSLGYWTSQWKHEQWQGNSNLIYEQGCVCVAFPLHIAPSVLQNHQTFTFVLCCQSWLWPGSIMIIDFAVFVTAMVNSTC